MAEDRTRQEDAWKSRDIPIAWLKADGATDGQALDRLRELIESGHREQDNEERATRGHLSPQSPARTGGRLRGGALPQRSDRHCAGREALTHAFGTPETERDRPTPGASGSTPPPCVNP